MPDLGDGEREVIVLAQELPADIVLIDEGDGRREAQGRGLIVTGTLGSWNARPSGASLTYLVRLHGCRPRPFARELSCTRTCLSAMLLIGESPL